MNGPWRAKGLDNPAPQVLLIGTDALSWCGALSAAGITAHAVDNMESARAQLSDGSREVLVLGPELPTSFVAELHERFPKACLVAFGSMTRETALVAAGADEVLFDSAALPDLVAAAARSIERGRLLAAIGGPRALDAARILDALARSTDPQALIAGLLRGLMAAVGGDRASALLPDGGGRSFVIAQQVGIIPPPPGLDENAAYVPAEGTVSGWVARERRPVLLVGPASAFVPTPLVAPDGPARCALCVPMLSAGRLVGLLNISDTTHEDAFDEEDLAFVAGISGAAAAAVERARLTERITAAKAEWEAAFDAYDMPVALFAPDLTVNRVNLCFARAAGISPAMAVGRELFEILHGEWRPLERAVREAFVERSAVVANVPDPFGRAGMVSTEIFPRIDGGPATAAFVVIRKAAEN